MESLYGSNWHEIELLLYLPLQKWTKKWKIREINHKKKIGKIRGKSSKSHKIEISYDVSKLMSFFEILVSYEMLLHVRFFFKVASSSSQKNFFLFIQKIAFFKGTKKFRE